MAGTAARCGCGGVVQVPGGRSQHPNVGMQTAPGIDLSQQASAPMGLDNLSADELSGAGYASPYQGYPGQAEYGGYPGAAHAAPPPENRRLSDDELLAGYLEDTSWKEPDQYSQCNEDGGYFAFEGGIINGGLIGGGLAVLAGAALFIIPLMYGWIVPYSLVLVVIGMIAIGRSLMNG